MVTICVLLTNSTFDLTLFLTFIQTLISLYGIGGTNMIEFIKILVMAGVNGAVPIK